MNIVNSINVLYITRPLVSIKQYLVVPCTVLILRSRSLLKAEYILFPILQKMVDMVIILMKTITITIGHQMEEQYLQNVGHTLISDVIQYLITLLIKMVEHFIYTNHLLMFPLTP